MPLNNQLYSSHEVVSNNQTNNNFQQENNQNHFFNGNECYGFQQNMKNPNNFYLPPQQQQPQIFSNGNVKNEDKDKQIFNAQSLAYSENFNPRSYIKNTYINKINNLMSNSLNEFKVNEEKK